MSKRIAAEFLGSLWLVSGGCGAAVISAALPNLGIGILGVALAFGLTVVTMAYAIGPISGAHLNPAVSLGLWMGGRFKGRDLPGYILAQVAGAIAGAGVLYVIATGSAAFTPQAGFATNGFGSRSLGQYTLLACAVTEVVMTFMFVMVILGATDRRAPAGFAPLAIGLTLTLIHLVSIPVTNTSVNPARSTGPALFAGGGALEQLWLFWVAPIAGALIAVSPTASSRSARPARQLRLRTDQSSNRRPDLTRPGAKPGTNMLWSQWWTAGAAAKRTALYPAGFRGTNNLI